MAIASLEQLVSEPDDPIAPLIGTLSCDLQDISSRHDEYLREAIAQPRKKPGFYEQGSWGGRDGIKKPGF